MAVSILTITHNHVGHELLATAKSMLGNSLPLTCKTLSISESCDPEKMLDKAVALCKEIDSGDGVLVLTDIFGSTPSNICSKIKSNCDLQIHVIAGLNLPMLIRVLNYPNLSMAELVDKALSGAHDGIIDCQSK